jgi:hypothetical protein
MSALWTSANFEAASPVVAQAFGINPEQAMDPASVHLAGVSPNIAQALGLDTKEMALAAALEKAGDVNIGTGGQDVGREGSWAQYVQDRSSPEAGGGRFA